MNRDLRYYQLVQRSPRGYQLMDDERVLPITALIRVPAPVEFDRLPRTRAAAAPNPVRLLQDKSYYAFEDSMQRL